VVGGGGLRGAYAVGVLRELHRHGGSDQFDAIYAVSVGVFASTFFAADQVSTLENSWRQHVHGSQLINFWNLFRGRAVLDLDYLIDIFQSAKSWLSLDRVYSAHPDLFYVVTNYHTGEPEYPSAKSPRIFSLMKASSALPIMYSKAVHVDGARYIDGGVSDPIPVQKALDDGCQDITVILTRPKKVRTPVPGLLSTLALRSKPARAALETMHRRWNDSERLLERLSRSSDCELTVFRPTQLEVTRLSRDRKLIVRAIDRGEADARKKLSP